MQNQRSFRVKVCLKVCEHLTIPFQNHGTMTHINMELVMTEAEPPEHNCKEGFTYFWP